MLSTCNKDNGFLCIIDNSTILFKTYAQQKPEKYSKNKNNVFRLFTSHAGKRIVFPPAASGEASPRQPEEGELEA